MQFTDHSPSLADTDDELFNELIDTAEPLFFNREVTWLAFNWRVLHEAIDSRTPLLERLGFLAIFNSNLDEFYQKRVGGLKRQIAAGVVRRTPDGLTAEEQLDAIRTHVLPMLEKQADAYENDILPALAEKGVHILKWHQLTDEEKAESEQYFNRNLFPVLTPLSVDPGHPFPFISNLSTSLGVILHNNKHKANTPDTNTTDQFTLPAFNTPESETHFARVKVPVMLPGWIQLKSHSSSEEGNPAYRFISLEDIISQFIGELFPGLDLQEVEPFRITRNADVDRDEEDVEDLLDMVEQELRDRRFAEVVRLEVDDSPSHPMNEFLKEELKLNDSDIYHMPSLLDYTNFWAVHGQSNLPELKYKPWTPTIPPRLRDDDADIFSVIRSGDVLVHHPYESFAASVERLIKAAADDPKVVAIKQTLYRTSSNSPFIPELIRAAEAGKQVVVLVELKARFDEENNVRLAQTLEAAGIHVVYGLVGLKTHTKTSLIVRNEADGMRSYCHIGTGNYNSKTAKLYTDLGLLTCDERITSEIVELFHYLTGRSQKKDFNHLLIAPINMRKQFIELIKRERKNCEAWKARGADPNDPNRPTIIAKMNSLEDRNLCRRLYEASQSGVRIKLIVRGFCCLRPGVKGLSENITVTSIIGRFLEHSRIYYFHNEGQPEYYIGSADWMYRNLSARVECVTPIYDPACQRRLQQILDIHLADHRQAWDMQPDGDYLQRTPDQFDKSATEAQGTHQTLMTLAQQEAAIGDVQAKE